MEEQTAVAMVKKVVKKKRGLQGLSCMTLEAGCA